MYPDECNLLPESTLLGAADVGHETGDAGIWAIAKRDGRLLDFIGLYFGDLRASTKCI